MSVKHCVCEQHHSKQPAVCELAKLDMDTFSWKLIHKHIRVLAGVPKFTVGPNTPWLYLYSPQKHTHTHGQVFGQVHQSNIHWN